MTFARPTLRLDFANNPGFIDPRFAFARASTATYVDRQGIMRTAPANAPRFDYDPVTLRSRGLLQEVSRTNLCIQSRAIDDIAWQKFNITVTANQANAADGTAALESLVCSANNGNVQNTCTIAAGSQLTVSVFARVFSSGFIKIQVLGSVDQVSCWFNLTTGATGTNTAGSSNVTFSAKDIEDFGGGLYRCALTVSTSTETGMTISISPAPSDGGSTLSGNSIYAGDVQFEAPAGPSHASSYIPTTTVAVTRQGDTLQAPITGPWYNANEGTLVFDFLVARRHPVQANVFGGLGNGFNDVLYISQSSTTITVSMNTGGVSQVSAMQKTITMTIGTRNRFAFAWKLNDLSFVLNGSVPVVDTLATLPVPTRILLGGAPWQSSGGNQPGSPVSRVDYYPRRLADTILQALTVAP